MWKIVVLLTLGILGCTGQPPAGFNGTDITGSAIGQSLAGLRDGHGQERSIAEFHGKAVVVFFGYTTCPDVCPTTLSRLAGVLKTLGAEAQRVQVILVSVDPETDTPEILGRYVGAFDPSFIGLSGNPAATEEVARGFKVFFSKGGHGHHAGGRAIDHTTGAYVFDPAGRIRLYVKDDASAEGIVGDLRRLLAEQPA
ncbi:MAG: SCO family protein [Propionivibrio sp.]